MELASKLLPPVPCRNRSLTFPPRPSFPCLRRRSEKPATKLQNSTLAYSRCSGAARGRLLPSTQTVDEAAVALGRFDRVEAGHGLALFREFAAGFAAIFRFAVEGLGDGSGAAHLAEQEHLDVEVAGIIMDAEQVAGADFAGGFGGLAAGFDPAEVAGAGGERPGFEEASGPQPLIDSDARHTTCLLPLLR